MNLQVGIKNVAKLTVTSKMTAKTLKSGTLDVLSTPMMIALIEQASAQSVELYLGEGKTSVGIKLDISHIAPTPIGLTVKACSELIKIDGRKLVFNIQVYDNKEKIGEGRHERFVVDSLKFITKAEAKRDL